MRRCSGINREAALTARYCSIRRSIRTVSRTRVIKGFRSAPCGWHGVFQRCRHWLRISSTHHDSGKGLRDDPGGCGETLTGVSGRPRAAEAHLLRSTRKAAPGSAKMRTTDNFCSCGCLYCSSKSLRRRIVDTISGLRGARAAFAVVARCSERQDAFVAMESVR